MNPQLPDDPDEVRRIADDLLARAMPDDLPQIEGGIIGIVELIARSALEAALAADDDEKPEAVRECVRLGVVVIHDGGNDPRDPSKGVGAVQYSELATTTTDTNEVALRLRLASRDEYLAATRIVADDSGTPWAVVLILCGICPEEAGELAGEPFVIVANASKNGDEITTQGTNGAELIDDERTPDDLRAALRSMLELARRSA